MLSKHHPSVWPHDHHLQIDQLALSFLLSPRDLSILIFLLQIEPPNLSLSSLVLLPPTLPSPKRDAFSDSLAASNRDERDDFAVPSTRDDWRDGWDQEMPGQCDLLQNPSRTFIYKYQFWLI